jgi:putative hydrolase of the HAD superfamily
MPMYKVAIFDIDGVLNNATRFSKRYAKKYNVPITRLNPFFGGPFQDCLVGKADLKEELAKVVSQWEYTGSIADLLLFWFAGEINENKEVRSAIMALNSPGLIKIGATNQEKYRTEYLTKALNLSELFAKTYSSAYLGVKKPNPQFYKSIANDLDISLAEIIYWDDDQENVEVANSLGMKAYQFTNTQQFLDQINKVFNC